ncbi:potassium transporter TrkA [Microcoleus sp. A003_D6]|uniref:potassium transporter TrkA n=1 Tax=Microcoleus sp. A003_D6 TaxID=3055266 RepID=UPI002FD1D78C
MALNAIQLPSSCQCLGLAREGQVILASENPAISWEDCILAVALNSAIAPELYVILKKTHPVLWTSFRSPFPRCEKYLSNEDFLVQLCCKD